MVIDFHTHMVRYDQRAPWVDEWLHEIRKEQFENELEWYSRPDAFVRMMTAAGVDRIVVLAEYAPVTTGICSNESVRQFCVGQERLIPFCSLNPAMPGHNARKLVRLFSEGFKGLKLYPTYNFFYPNDHALYPLYKVCQQHGKPVMFHTGSSIFRYSRLKYGNPVYIDDVAVDFPELNIIMAHGGRGCWYGEAAMLARLHPNVYIDISGLPAKKLPQYFPDLKRLSSKLIFGSDYPGLPGNIADNIVAVKELPIDDESKAMILGGNAVRILRQAGVRFSD